MTIFGRSSGEENMDTVLQRGRWFGHKMKADLIAIHLQDNAKEIFRQIAESDRYLRLQIKQALHNELKPLQVLLELRNSPHIKPTSRKKRSFLSTGHGFSFSGKRALLISPSFEINDILHNEKLVEDMLANHVRTKVYDRAKICMDIDPGYLINIFKKFKCDLEAPHVSFKLYANFLEDWRDKHLAGEEVRLPKINLAIMNGVLERQRQLRTTSYPNSRDQVIREATTKFGTIVGGKPNDAFMDIPEAWDSDKLWTSGNDRKSDDILIVIYRLHPNYIRKSYFDKSLISSNHKNGQPVRGNIYLPNNHELFIPQNLPVYTFAAWTPEGGPMYDIGYNRLINQKEIKQRGLHFESNGI